VTASLCHLCEPLEGAEDLVEIPVVGFKKTRKVCDDKGTQFHTVDLVEIPVVGFKKTRKVCDDKGNQFHTVGAATLNQLLVEL